MQGWFSKPAAVLPGTREGISGCIHALNSQGDRAKEGHRYARRHNANSLGERVESCVTLVTSIVVAGARISGWCVSRSRGVKGSAEG